MNLQQIITEIEKTDPEVYERLDGRRSAIKGLAGVGGKIALAAVPFALGSMFNKAYGQSGTGQIIGVLNFALTLEHLEATFYNTALASGGLIPNATARGAIQTIADHENEHVAFLTSAINALGGMPVAAPAFDFTAKGNFTGVFSNYGLFLAVAQTFEDTGVRAYKGQAGNLISSNPILRAALQIHSVEARHAAHIREMRARYGGPLVAGTPEPWITLNQSNIASPAVQASYNGEELTTQAGINIVGINGFSISDEEASEAFDEPLTKEQVIKIVTPFFA